MSIATVNPYANHPQLSPLEGEVLWEYAKLSDTIKKIAALARDTSENPNEPLLENLRDLEKKMKLVFTTLQTSVYLITQEHLAKQEAELDAADTTVGAQSQYDNSVDEGDSTIRY